MNSNNKPKLRFKGFSEDWELRELSTLLTSYVDPVDVPSNGYERLGIRSHAKGTFHSYVPAGQELQAAQMHRVASNKFILNITFAWEHAVAITDKKDAGKLVSHRFPQFSLSEDLLPSFFKYIIQNEKFRYHLWLSSPGGAGRNRVLNIPQMLQYKIFIPKVKEQEKIAETLSNVDNILSSYQNKYLKLTNIKKSLLNKLFPTSLDKKPRLRFKGYSEDWDSYNLESLCTYFTDGDWIEAKDQSNKGIRLIQTGNVGKTEFIEKENNKKYVSLKTFNELHCKEIFPGDILISRLPEPAGRACIIPNIGKRMITAVDCTIVRPSIKCDSSYLVQYLSTPDYFKVVNSYLGGGTRQRISRGNLSEITIKLPEEIEEQEKIGKLLSEIDKLINLYKCKIEKTSCLRQALINNLIV